MYSIIERTVIFNWDFNEILNDTMLNDIASCNTIIFNNYNDLNTCYQTNNEQDDKYCNGWKGSNFNQRLDNLPFSIINLTLGHRFNQHLDNLPHGIRDLTLGSKFNQPLDNLPSSIINLTLGDWFDQSLDNLPHGIRDLNLGLRFNRPLDNLPNSIRNLTLCDYFNQSLDNLPSSLNKIIFKTVILTSLKFNQEIKKIPQNLTLVVLSQIQDDSHLKKEFGKFNVEIIG
jgi:hypothetical protein